MVSENVSTNEIIEREFKEDKLFLAAIFLFIISFIVSIIPLTIMMLQHIQLNVLSIDSVFYTALTTLNGFYVLLGISLILFLLQIIFKRMYYDKIILKTMFAIFLLLSISGLIYLIPGTIVSILIGDPYFNSITQFIIRIPEYLMNMLPSILVFISLILMLKLFKKSDINQETKNIKLIIPYILLPFYLLKAILMHPIGERHFLQSYGVFWYLLSYDLQWIWFLISIINNLLVIGLFVEFLLKIKNP